jgi:uncharacterized protein YuzE
MQICYDATADLLYLRFDDRQQEIVNKRLSEDVVLDIGEANKIVGIEIVDASARLDLGKLLPIEHVTQPSL